MKSILKITALLTSVALPGALALEFVGGPAASAVNSLHVFISFVAAFIVLTLFNDYARPARRGVLIACPRATIGHRLAGAPKSAHALAA